MGTKTQKLSNVVDQIVEWQSVVVADGSTNTTGVSGRGYFVDASAGAHTINLPASPKIGDIIKVSIITAGNELTIGRNGNNINGSASDLTTSADGDMFEFVYINASEGWKTVGQISAGTYISATGGTITTSGDYKIHSFTGDGCFVVSSAGNGSSNPLGGPSTVDYLVIAGGGAGGDAGARGAGGGGAGGFRESKDSTLSSPHTASPLANTTGLTISATTYPITVGGGGASSVTPNIGGNGSNSVFSTITSTGGGGGGGESPTAPVATGQPGGSGGGAGRGSATGPAGSGNTPPTTPAQGTDGGTAGGTGDASASGGGGGGATVTGTGGASSVGGNGGTGATTSINGSPTTFAGGGGGSVGPGGTVGSGGSGGGGIGGSFPSPAAGAGTANTGGGGGGASDNAGGGSGGKGIVIIRYKFQ